MNLEGLGIKRQILFKSAALIMPQDKLRARKTTEMYQCNVLKLHTMINVPKANKYFFSASGQMQEQYPQIRPQTLPSLSSLIRV
jgi:hypothetical protein